MKIYKYKFNNWKKTTVTKQVLEYDEKPKCYERRDTWSRERVRKADIGKAVGYSEDVVYLLEDNFAQAREVFVGALKRKIWLEKQRIEQAESRINKCFESIDVLNAMESAESEE